MLGASVENKLLARVDLLKNPPAFRHGESSSEIMIKKALCDFSGIEYKQPDTSEIIQQPTDIAVSDNDSED